MSKKKAPRRVWIRQRVGERGERGREWGNEREREGRRERKSVGYGR